MARPHGESSCPVEIEPINKTMPAAGHVVMPGGILLRECDVQHATKVLDVERRIAARDLGIGKGTGCAEVRVEYVDLSGAEVSRIQMVGETIEAESQALVDRAGLDVEVVDLGGRGGLRRPS